MSIASLLKKRNAAAAVTKAVEQLAPSKSAPVPASDIANAFSMGMSVTKEEEQQQLIPTELLAPLQCNPEISASHPALEQAIINLRDSMVRKDGMIVSYLTEIHACTAQFPELVHLLTDEQAAVVYQAWLQKTATSFADTGKSGRAKPKAAKVNPSDAAALLEDMNSAINMDDLFS